MVLTAEEQRERDRQRQGFDTYSEPSLSDRSVQELSVRAHDLSYSDEERLAAVRQIFSRPVTERQASVEQEQPEPEPSPAPPVQRRTSRREVLEDI